MKKYCVMIMVTVVLMVHVCAPLVWAFDAANVFSKPEVHGFVETRSGYRLRNDPYEKDMSIMETRMQLEASTYTDWFDLKYKGDAWGDMVLEKAEYETREAWLFMRPTDFMDIKIGRQVLTWGTGDWVFLNDLFPKDWQSFFIGRDTEYLKASSDAAKVSLFSDVCNLDIVYTPQFDSDNYITGEYVSHWNGTEQRISGRDKLVSTDEPDGWFSDDDEVAVRAYRNINNYEYALYGYWGFWKNPKGKTTAGIKTFPPLHVYGASVRGAVFNGIGNAEIAYYDSRDDASGTDVLIPNSEMRYLVGYTQDVAKDFNVSVQYYIEHMLDYKDYEKSVTSGPLKDRLKHLITVQGTKLFFSQNVEVSVPVFYSPSDNDAYVRPVVSYKYSDNIIMEAGANIFFGKRKHTLFAQFKENTNAYVAVRCSF